MSGLEITCINKDHRGLLIRLGGSGWSMTTHEAVVKLISQQLRLYLRTGENYSDVGVRGEGFAAYLVVEPEEVALHELTGLPSC